MREKRRFYSLLTVLIVLGCLLSGLLVITLFDFNGTSTRYIRREQDEIIGYYTSLYFDTTGTGSAVALENNVGYVNFTLMNFIEEDVTKRDIEYSIKTVSDFYDSTATKIINPNGTQDLHVLDVWNQPKKVGNDTCKYAISVADNNGEAGITDDYMFSYEKRDESAVGKTHQVTVRLERNFPEEIAQIEYVSIVIQLTKPYKEVYIIDIVVSNRLIVFSNASTNVFDIDFENVKVQTANAFGYYINGEHENVIRKNTLGNDFSSKAFKVVFKWDNLIVNEHDLLVYHNNQEGLITGTPDNLDIKSPYLINIDQDDDSGTLEIYMPQASDFEFQCLSTDSNYWLYAVIYIFDSSTNQYVPYDDAVWGGYHDESITPIIATDSNGKADIIKKTTD